MTSTPRSNVLPDQDASRQRQLLALRAKFKEASNHEGRIDFEAFHDAIGSRNKFFSEAVFGLMDVNKDKTIDSKEFIDFISHLRNSDDKINLLFDMYDRDKDGFLTYEEVAQMLQAMMEESLLEVSPIELASISRLFFEEASQGENSVSKAQFFSIVKSQTAFSEDISTLLDGWIGALGNDGRRNPKTKKNKHTGYYGKLSVANYPTFYAFLGVFMALIFCMMIIAGAMHHKATGLDGNSNHYLIVARVFGFPLNFVAAMVFLLMTRPLVDFLRRNGLRSILPLDHHLFFHILSGYIIFVFAVIHTVMHFLNFSKNVTPDPMAYLAHNGKRPDMIGFEDGNFTYAEWMFTPKPGLFGTIPGYANITGVILMVIMVVMVLTSLQCVRRKGFFNVFYFSHLLYWAFFVLLIIHAPNFTYFSIIPGFFLVLHVIHVWLQGREKQYVVLAKLLPSNTVSIAINKANMNFSPGDWVFVNIPSLARYEWHAFTISSAPDKPFVFTLHIKGVGPWTNALRNKIADDFEEKITVNKTVAQAEGQHKMAHLINLVQYNNPMTSDVKEGEDFPIYIDGPYHAPTTDIFNAEHAVLFATGIGVTPMSSILQSILIKHQKATMVCPNCHSDYQGDLNRADLGRLKKVEFHWIVKDPAETSWFLDLLTQLEIQQKKLQSNLPQFLDIYIYATRAISRSDMTSVGLRIAMNLFHEKKNRDFLTGLTSRTEPGRPDLKAIFQRINREKVGDVGVFFCGNTHVGNLLEGLSAHHKFDFHREVF